MSTWRNWNLWRNNKVINNVITMSKSGVSYNVYMRRVWMFYQTLSSACFIYYYTLASPAGNFVSSYMCGHYLVSKSESFQGCASNMRERASQQGFQGEKIGRGYFLFALSPLTPFPFRPRPIPFMSSSSWRKCFSRSSYSLTWKKRVPHTCKKTQSCLRSRLITPNM